MNNHKLIAKQLARYGRNGDTELVHMTKGEIRGLHSLARSLGGNLSRNPATGLTEANFFKDLTSSPLGSIGLGLLLGPAGFGLGALGTGAAIGGTSLLAGNSLDTALASAVTGGSAASIGGSLAAGGEAATAAGNTALGGAPITGADLATNIGTQGGASLGGVPVTGAEIMPGASTGFTPTVAASLPPNMASAGAGYAAAPTSAAGFGDIGTGVQALGTEGNAAAFFDANTMPILGAVGGAGALKGIEYQEDMARTQEEKDAQGKKERDDTWRRIEDIYAASGQQYPFRSHIGGYARGGAVQGIARLINGPGDGMSDSIPAVVDGSVPAKLSSGEFVLPSDVVAHMGNGDRGKGAEMMYQMMARIRKDRTGSSRQPNAVNPGDYMPV